MRKYDRVLLRMSDNDAKKQPYSLGGEAIVPGGTRGNLF